MSKMEGVASRAAAAQVCHAVLEQGRSLTQALAGVSEKLEPRDRALAQALSYGVMRHLPFLNQALSQYLAKPLKKDLLILHHLLLVGAYQLLFMQSADHGTVSATVEAAIKLRRSRQKGLVNAVLRSIQRARSELLDTFAITNTDHQHPRWLADTIRKAYPANADAIMAAANQQAPLWLRVNQQHVSRDEFCAALTQDHELGPLPESVRLLEPIDVTQLPGYAQGWFSVQDIAAQHAAHLVDPQANERILDCCAAPGGKTAHLLERQPAAQVLALDIDRDRLARVQQNLTRLELDAELIEADATAIETWWQGEAFDRILLDAPCSATGVIRRHPDIKWLRRASDIANLVEIQAELLAKLWQLLKPGGTLVYATCSILPAENHEQIQRFLQQHADATALAIAPDGATEWQWLPGDDNGDGFYYAKLEKRK